MAIRYLRICLNLGARWCEFALEHCSYVGPDLPVTVREHGILAPTLPLTPKYNDEYERGNDTSTAVLYVTFHQPYLKSKISLSLRVPSAHLAGTVKVHQKRKRSYKVVGEFQDFLLKDCVKLSADFDERTVTIIYLSNLHDTQTGRHPPVPTYIWVFNVTVC